MLEKIALTDKGLNERADAELQVLNMFSSCISILVNPDSSNNNLLIWRIIKMSTKWKNTTMIFVF